MAQLTREQAAALNARIGPMVRYLVRVRERATKVGFTQADEFYRVILKAEDALRHLSVVLHYASVARGVGKPSEVPGAAELLSPPGSRPG